LHDETFSSPQARSISFSMSQDASWRIVVRARRPGGIIAGTYNLPELAEGQEELIRIDPEYMPVGGAAWGQPDRMLLESGMLPGRASYLVRASCDGAGPMRWFLGDEINGKVVADTETEVPCDAVVHETFLGIAAPHGSRLYVAAAAGRLFSLIVSSATPPVARTTDLPGWQLSGGLGPEYAFDTRGMSFAGAGVGEDHIQVVLACTGTQPIEVSVEDAITQTFSATCTPEGNTTAQTFHVTEQGVSVRYVAPKGSWTALSILVPSK
jgi:hypothetical protein